TLTKNLWLSDKTLELEDVHRQVDLYYPSLDSAELERELAKAEIMGAKSSFIPRFAQRSLLESYRELDLKRKEGFTFSSELSWQSPFAVELIGSVRATTLPVLAEDGLIYNSNKAFLDSVKKSKLYGYNDSEMSFGLRLPILRNLLIDSYRADLKQAKLLSSSAEYGILKKRADLFLESSHKYWSWVMAGMNYRVAEKMLQLSKERLEGTNERVKEGASPPIDFVEAQSQVTSREEALIKARRDLEKEAISLSLYIWMNELDLFTPSYKNLPESIPEPLSIKTEIINEHQLSALMRPEIFLLDIESKQESINLRLAKNEMLPKLDLEVLPTQSLEDFDDGTNIRGSLVLDVPLYPLKAKSQILKAKTKLEKNSLAQRQIKAAISNEIRDAVSYLETSRERIARSREAFDQLNQLAEAERIRFKFGSSNLFLLNQREISAAQAETKLIEALADHQKALANYRYAIGEWSIPNFDKTWISKL
ncbi:MAG: TolC family protein, partial [Candidatus Caenarcaniphilales bacterium]|nr:TolC family protein [Candidatus Caenarcaniphilales bacterium]